MSSYTAIIKCNKCGRELAKIKAYHNEAGMFVPQDIWEQEYKLSSIFCQECLNGRSKIDEKDV